MSFSLLPALTVALPASTAAAALVLHRRGRPASALTAAAVGAAATLGLSLASAASVAGGANPTLALGGTAVLRVDAVAAAVTPFLALVGTTVLLYARRALDGDLRGGRFGAAAGLLLTGTVVGLLADRLSVLAIGWFLASLATVGLCASRGDARSLAAARRTGRVLALGDAALAAGVLLVLAVAGDTALGGPALATAVEELRSHTLLELGGLRLDAATAAALLLVAGAAARAGQLPFRRWLPGTVAAPTPVSALLHAGAVNAGGILLVRTGSLLAAAPLAATALVVAALATIASTWSTHRADAKGRLAVSTQSQMAFMLLACAVGAPVAALTHLAGHSLYKSARFLGVGDAVRRSVQLRRFGPAAHHGALAPAGLAAAALAGTAVAAAWWGVSAAAEVPSAERWIVGAAVSVAAARAARAAVEVPRAATAVAAVATAAVATAGSMALAAEHAVGSAVDHGAGYVDARLVLLAIAVLACAHLAASRRPTVAPRLLALCAIGTARTPRPSRAPLRRPAGTAAVEPAW